MDTPDRRTGHDPHRSELTAALQELRQVAAEHQRQLKEARQHPFLRAMRERARFLTRILAWAGVRGPHQT